MLLQDTGSTLAGHFFKGQPLVFADLGAELDQLTSELHPAVDVFNRYVGEFQSEHLVLGRSDTGAESVPTAALDPDQLRAGNQEQVAAAVEGLIDLSKAEALAATDEADAALELIDRQLRIAAEPAA
jgi:hypothetical protein